MIKTLRTLFKQDREKFVVPKTVQQAIPINAVYDDGIFIVGKKYSKSFRFDDINYAVASKEDNRTSAMLSRTTLALLMAAMLELPVKGCGN